MSRFLLFMCWRALKRRGVLRRRKGVWGFVREPPFLLRRAPLTVWRDEYSNGIYPSVLLYSTSLCLMAAVGLGCAKTPAVAPHVEISLSNCICGSQIILHKRRSMPCRRIVFSTFRGCMSFYTGSVSSAAVD